MGKFQKKELLKSDMVYEVILIDASESPIEHPKKKSEIFKSQVVIDKKTKMVICTTFSNGKKHDHEEAY